MGQLCIFQQTARSVCSLVYWVRVWIILDTPVFQLMPNDCLFLCVKGFMFPRAVRVFVLSTSCYWGQKLIHILFEQNTKEIKEDISIVKLNISNLTEPSFCWKCHRNNQKSLICILLNQNHPLNALMPK